VGNLALFFVGIFPVNQDETAIYDISQVVGAGETLKSIRSGTHVFPVTRLFFYRFLFECLTSIKTAAALI
jgi:hypothetical protein